MALPRSRAAQRGTLESLLENERSLKHRRGRVRLHPGGIERVLRRRIMTLPGVGNVEANVLLTEERRPGPLGVAESVGKA